MMKRLYAAFVDGFGLEAGRELFEQAELGLEREARETEREEHRTRQCRFTRPARSTK
jgi:hypothetical protein